jgi:hypothetical protein
VLKKSFLTNERKFLGPLMRLVRRDVRDHIVTPKIEHGSSWRRYRALQRQGSLRISFREIFNAAQFSSFSTVSALSGHAAVVAGCPLLGVKRTSGS